MNGSQGSTDRAAAVDQFENIFHIYATKIISYPTEELHRMFAESVELGLRALKTWARRDPDKLPEYIRMAIGFAETLVLVNRLIHGPTCRSHINRLIDAFPPEERVKLFFEREATKGDVVTRRSFDEACGHFVAECDAQRKLNEEVVAAGSQIISKLYEMKAGAKKNWDRCWLLAWAKVMSENGTTYKELLPFLNQQLAQAGAAEIRSVPELRIAITKERTANPFFEGVLYLVEQQYEADHSRQ
ncbi:MAG TPA: hypothetical protein VH092_06815, partial [Urbifossiella sp.]|nr:hypothetical protein [Urbifossiella sp.]